MSDIILKIRAITPPALRPVLRAVRRFALQDVLIPVARFLYRMSIRIPGASPSFFFFPVALNGSAAQKTVLSVYHESDFIREARNEPATFEWIDKMQPGQVLYDCGASTGCFSIYAARRGVRAFAFEPSLINAATLDLNLKANTDSLRAEVAILPIALGNKLEVTAIHFGEYVPGFHQNIVESATDRISGEAFKPDQVRQVIAMPLDQAITLLNLPYPDHLKIDVDGSEERLLAGASATLRHPGLKSVLIEVAHPDDVSCALIQLIESFGFVEVDRKSVGNYYQLFNILFERAK